MDVEGSPRTIIAIPKKIGKCVSFLSICWWPERSHHLPLGGTIMGADVMFEVLDMTIDPCISRPCHSFIHSAPT